MKKILYLILASSALIACSKLFPTAETAEPVNDNYGPTGKEVCQLFVSIAPLKDMDTKATISTSTGHFSWKAND